MKKILLYEPFYKGSHKYFADRLLKHSEHKIDLLVQNGVFWKWRLMQSSILGELPLDHDYDIILTTNMVNLASWSGINRKALSHTKLIHFFHENQFSYPGENDPEMNIYAFMDFASALAADSLVFNSHFHLESFLEHAQNFSKKVPDKIPQHLFENIKEKAFVLPIGIEVEKLLEQKVTAVNEAPIILWNHRHEWDKNPELFFATLEKLKAKGIAFKLVVLGSEGRNTPSVFNEAKNIFTDEILHRGRVEHFEEYAKWLWRADILPVTSNHDFFGISVLEAALCHCHLLLPQRNAYTDHFPIKEFSQHYYETDYELFEKLAQLLQQKQYQIDLTSQVPLCFAWPKVAEKYDKYFNN